MIFISQEKGQARRSSTQTPGPYRERDATRREVEKRARLLQNANESLDPSGEHQRYDVDVMTVNVRRDRETAERDLAQANEALEESARDAWPAPVHFGALGLLFAGFVCQLVAEIMKAVARNS